MKKLSAKTGEYTNQQGETKGRYTNVGVIMQSSYGGELLLLDPTVSLAGIMQAQNQMASAKGEQLRDRAMISVFEDNQDNQQPPQQQQYQQPQQGYPPQQAQNNTQMVNNNPPF